MTLNSRALGGFLIAGQIPGLLLNCYCAHIFRKRLRDSVGRLVIPFLIAFLQTIVDVTVHISAVASNIVYFIDLAHLSGGYGVCVLYSNGLISMTLGMRALLNFFVAIFNYIKLLHPFTPSPMPLKKLIPTLFAVAVGVSLTALVGNAAEKTYVPQNGTCRWLSAEEPGGHSRLTIGRLMSLFSFVYLYVLSVFGTIYIYAKIISTLQKAIADNEDDDDDGSDGGDEGLQHEGGEARMRHLVINELQKTLALDGLMASVLFATIFLSPFLRRFCHTDVEHVQDGSSGMSQIRRLIGSFYSTFYVVFSLLWRRIYRAPAECMTRSLSRHLGLSYSKKD